MRKEALDVGRRVVRGHVIGFVPKQRLAVLELIASGPQVIPIGVFQIVHPNRAKARRTRTTQFFP